MSGARMRAAIRAEIAAELDRLEQAGHRRRRPAIDSGNDRTIVLAQPGPRRRLINWASNDYLGYAQHRKLRNAAARALRSYGAGAGSARLLSGGLRCHRRLEQRLANWLGSEDVLITTSGFQGNLATIASLAGSRHDAIVLDRLCHASLYDGARLSGARLLRFAHNDPADCARKLARVADARRVVVAVESVYSMDGDEAPLPAIDRVCREHGALLVVDEAHALGVLGPGGRGGCAEAGIRPDVITATCSKALGSQGGIVAADQDLIDYCVNRGRSFIFSTAAAPATVGAAVAGLDLLRDDPEQGRRLIAEATAMRAAIAAQGWEVVPGRTPIIPVVVGAESAACRLAAALRERGHFAPAIRPPTVPPNTCRLRLTLTLAHTRSDRRRLLADLATCRALQPSG